MLSFPDIAIVSGLALIIFGPERLPKMARQVGQAVGMMRSTANSFVYEMERVPNQDPAVSQPKHEARPLLEQSIITSESTSKPL